MNIDRILAVIAIFAMVTITLLFSKDSKPNSVEWFGRTFYAPDPGKPIPNRWELFKDVGISLTMNAEIGLRSDGVVVWRPIKKENKPTNKKERE